MTFLKKQVKNNNNIQQLFKIVGFQLKKTRKKNENERHSFTLK